MLLGEMQLRPGSCAMNQLAPTKHESLSGPICRDCGARMRLFGIEAHPTVDRTELRTYVCSYCDEVQTEDVPLPELKASS
jgi:hypothetical protein